MRNGESKSDRVKYSITHRKNIISTKTTVKLTDGVLNQGRTEQSGSHVEARVEKNKTKNQFIQ